MVANMALPVRQPQHPSTREGAADNHQYAWLLKADTGCKGMEGHSHGTIQSSDECSSSWEARAFAEDASSLAAGIWPPRAYPCSFCRREFRSAQALGGHMNVHRRDRARLRHSSPPPPFCATHNISLQPGTIIHKSQRGYSSTASLNPNACPDIIYPNGPLSKIPTARALSAISPQNSTACLAARCPSDIAASFPLRLHLLASEAASTLMLPQAHSSDLLSLWPASTIDTGNGCHPAIGTSTKGSTIDISSWSPSSSSSIVLNCAVTPSMGATLCRRARHDAPVIQLEDESPRKKSNVANNSDILPYPIMKLKNPAKEEGMSQAHGKQSSDILGNVEESIRMQHAAEARSNCVDLELRLGPRPP